MAVLESRQGRVVLRERHLVGRSRAADLRVPAREVSGEHAVFRWTGDRWELRDLGSRNGTWVDEQKLEAGGRTTVQAGARIAFGEPETSWVLTTDSGPAAAAITDGGVLEGTNEFLALPSLDDPQVILEFEIEHGWQRIQDGETALVNDGSTIVIEGTAFLLSLPPPAAPMPMTAEIRDLASLVESFEARGLDFAVSADEEYIEVTARLGAKTHAIPPRVHHELLLALARQRLTDRSEGIAESEQGWLYTSDLRKMLHISANQFYVMSHRCKREMEQLGVDPVLLLEKRTTSRQVRLGLTDLTVRSL
jgi:hypothetical protein